MVFNKPLYHSANPRRRKMEEEQLKSNRQILAFISAMTEPRTAEEIWLELKTRGLVMSIATFHTRIKKMVEAGLVQKEAHGYNKYLYVIAEGNDPV